jgi:SnoaL-like domain
MEFLCASLVETRNLGSVAAVFTGGSLNVVNKKDAIEFNGVLVGARRRDTGRAMSEENVEIVRGLVAAWNQRQSALALDFLAPHAEWLPAGPAAVEATTYRGPDEIAAGFESVWQTWEQFRFEESQTRDLDETVLWLGRVKMRGAASHVELDQEFALRAVLHDGKIGILQAFLEWQDALKAAGLTE